MKLCVKLNPEALLRQFTGAFSMPAAFQVCHGNRKDILRYHSGSIEAFYPRLSIHIFPLSATPESWEALKGHSRFLHRKSHCDSDLENGALCLCTVRRAEERQMVWNRLWDGNMEDPSRENEYEADSHRLIDHTSHDHNGRPETQYKGRPLSVSKYENKRQAYFWRYLAGRVNTTWASPKRRWLFTALDPSPRPCQTIRATIELDR